MLPKETVLRAIYQMFSHRLSNHKNLKLFPMQFLGGKLHSDLTAYLFVHKPQELPLFFISNSNYQEKSHQMLLPSEKVP